MANHQDDLDLLLSLQDRVLETPPASPSTLHSPSPGYLSDDGSPKRTRQVDMSDFHDAVQDCLDYGPENAKQALKSNQISKSNDPLVEKFSGLRIRNQLVSSAELINRFSDIRFVRLQAIKNVLMGDTLSGCWATVGVLVEKGIPKRYSTEMAGTVLALFNCAVRKDNLGAGFSLSVYSATHVLKIGTSADYGVCKGKRKDGMACTLVINKRHGIYCSYHRSKASQKYSVTRTELKGGNLKTAFRNPLKSEGIYLVDPLADRTNVRKPMQPVKLLSVDALKRALSNAGKVTTNIHSQGIRFLTEVTGKLVPKSTDGAYVLPNLQSSTKRSFSSTRCDTSSVRSPQTNAKRTKLEDGLPKKAEVREKMIELDFVSSDEEM